MIVPCPCGEDHEVPAALEEAIHDYGKIVAVDLDDLGVWRIPKVFLYYHGVIIDQIPGLAARYGFEQLSPKEATSPDVTGKL